LVLRDIDILKKIRNVEVGLTINTLNQNLQKIIEPGASSPQQRLAALKKLNQAGIETYGFISPVLPEITDLESLVKQIKPHVNYFYIETLNTYPACWRSLEKCLKNKKPDLLDKYKKIFLIPENKKDYISTVKKQAGQLKKKYNIPINTVIHGQN
jgi:DNA repair photolyase